MELVQKLLQILQNIGPYVAAGNAVLLSLIALFMLVPGEQPEKALKKISEIIEKFSKK